MSRFFKLSGAGNDFIALIEPDDAQAVAPDTGQIRAWCTRGLSIGADGLFRLAPSPGGVRMTYWNADGSAAALCLNGTRCAAQLAVHLGWTGPELTVDTDAGSLPARVIDSSTVALDLGVPESAPKRTSLELEEGEVAGWRVTVGNPHFVVFQHAGLDGERFSSEAPRLRCHDALGPPGANVHYALVEDPHTLRLRSWERGVEGETLACGTGALGSVAAGLAGGTLTLPVTVHTSGGFELTVGPPRQPSAHWSLTGDARLLLEGELTAEAGRFPGAR